MENSMLTKVYKIKIVTPCSEIQKSNTSLTCTTHAILYTGNTQKLHFS